MSPTQNNTTNSGNLKEVALLFFRLGCTAFGGPAVHIAMMQDEVVNKKKWMTQDHFLDLIGATNLIPGPNSTEMTMHCGQERAGIKGLIVAGFCFIMPAVVITAVFAWAYHAYGNLPEVAPLIYGIKPAILAVIFSTMIRLAKKALKSVTLVLMGIACIIACFLGWNEIIILFGAGATGIVLHLLQVARNKELRNLAPLIILQVPALKLFFTFLKIGSILYGSGYVLFAFLDTELVKKGMLSHKELVDAIAVGQFTPGPVFSSATFIGWQIGGLPGAIAATIGIFLPSFIFVALMNPLVARLRKSGVMSAFLDTVNVASIALIAAICITMGKESITDWRGIAIAVMGLIITFLFKNLNSAFIVLGGALAGYLLMFLH